MCTVTILPFKGRGGSVDWLRIVCNRDESPRRSAAEGPAWRHARFDPEAPAPSPNQPTHHTRALWPMDPEAGGTWIAAATSGMAMALLNLNPDDQADAPPPARVSRGLIIPSLIAAPTIARARAALHRIDLTLYAPFRLVAASLHEHAIAQAAWDGRSLHHHELPLAPACFASSGLGDSRVASRIDLFNAIVVAPGPTPRRQDHFHRHHWADRPEISVLMARPGARTVSITTAELRRTSADAAVHMIHEPVQYASTCSTASLIRFASGR